MIINTYSSITDQQIRTLQIIRNLHVKDSNHVHYISFARNFGKEFVMATGFNNITRDYVTEMDVDLQDSPSLFPKMLKYINKDGLCPNVT